MGDALGNGKIAFSGSVTSFVQKGVIGSQTYSYLVYAYNGTGAARDYLQLNPLTGSVITPQTGEGNYYQNIDPSLPTFVTDLQTRIRNPYTHIDYALFDETNVADFAFIDTTGGQRAAVCVYTGQRVNYTPPFAWTPNTPFSREHTWCASWMPSSPNTLADEYSDQHHLFVTNQNNANGVRGNHPLDEVVSVTSSFLEGKFGLNAAGDQVYEPRESHKGNAARALLYMALKYHGINGMDWSFNHLNQSIQIGRSHV